MTPTWQVITGDCLDVLPTLAADSVDAVVTDPPAGIAFMGKEWDKHKGGRAQWVEWMTAVMSECHRVLKPGGHALVWALPRTSHWTATAVEDAGFEIREKVYFLHGQGFPKSLSVGKAIDKAAGETREKVGIKTRPDGTQRPNMAEWDYGQANDYGNGKGLYSDRDARLKANNITAPSTDAARQWDGWGTALKPAVEEWILARKPLIGTVAANVLEWGTGAINIDAARIPTNGDTSNARANKNGTEDTTGYNGGWKPIERPWAAAGRWPANLIHDGTPEVLAGFPVTGISSGGRIGKKAVSGINIVPAGRYEAGDPGYGDTGSAARFFYCAKASKADRDEGLEGFEEKAGGHYAQDKWSRENMGNTPDAERKPIKNNHPTVKPVTLMRYLCRLITPPGGVILDPFTGSGSTGKAAMLEGFSFVGVEQDADYADIARARITKAAEQARQLELI